MSLRRLMPIIAIAVIGLPSIGTAQTQNCTTRPTIEIGFTETSITIFEGKTANLEVTATYAGDHSKAEITEINYVVDKHAWYQHGEFNQSSMITGSAEANDFTGGGGTLPFIKGSNSSRSIPITITDDGEDEPTEKFYVSLSIPTGIASDADPSDPATYVGGHRTKEYACKNPAIRIKNNRYFATVNIRDKSLANHWLYGNR